VFINFFLLYDEWNLSGKVQQLLNKLDVEQGGAPKASEFFQERPALEDYILESQAIDICGVMLSSVIRDHFSDFREALRMGVDIKIMLMDPWSNALEMNFLRSESSDISYQRNVLCTSLQDLEFLYHKWKKDAQETPDGSGQLQIRLLPFPPSFGITSFTVKNTDITFVEIFPHKRKSEKSTIFAVEKNRDPHWHQYYEQQFIALWGAARPWIPDQKEDNSILATIKNRGSINKFLSFKKLITGDIFLNAKTIDISGMTLGRTIREHLDVLSKRVAQGASVRVMILSPTEQLLKELSLRSVGSQETDVWRDRIASVEGLVEVLAKLDEKRAGKVEIGLLPYIPSFGITIVSGEDDDELCHVELYHHESAVDNPNFVLHSKTNREEFQFFKQQFEIMWNRCTVKEY
jgi:hypothetical protein